MPSDHTTPLLSLALLHIDSWGSGCVFILVSPECMAGH